MTDAPRFVRFESPFWFAMQGYDDEQMGLQIDITPEGRQILLAAGEVPDDVPYVGVVHTDSVLPVSFFDADSKTVAVRLPKPWDETQEGIPLVPGILAPADEQGEPPHIEAVSYARARELFPEEFRPVTQDDLDAWADELDG